MLTVRFDMRAPEGAARTTDLYAAAVDMCAWAESRGAVVAVLSEHHGTDDGHLAVLLPMLRGERVSHRGREIRVSPSCAGESPLLLIAGASKTAARRAARHGLGFISQVDSPELREYHLHECRSRGPLGLTQFPESSSPTTVFVTDEVDRGWDELGPYLLHDAVTAASYRR